MIYADSQSEITNRFISTTKDALEESMKTLQFANWAVDIETNLTNVIMQSQIVLARINAQAQILNITYPEVRYCSAASSA